ncbi:MAG: exosortase/archaeosortase family protein [Lentisphaerae bacterium]|nr:exosortase/archaeosortase family protein [Lentisphaerota bacterium]
MTGSASIPRVFLRALPLFVGGALLAVLFGFLGNAQEADRAGRSAVLWMVRRWSGGGGDLSHGWLIPLVSGYLVWRDRAKLASTPKRASGVGLILVAALLLLHWGGVRVQQTRLSLLSLAGLTWAIPLSLYGAGVARLLVFPCAYLLFCIPLSFLNEVSLPLRLVAGAMSVWTLNGLGIPAVRSGTAIFAQGPADTLSFDVADACSGLRSLLAMMALTAIYAHLTQRNAARKWTLFVASLPIAVVANVFRITAVAVVARLFGQESGLKLYHDYSGFLVFGAAVLMMAAAGDLIRRLGAKGPAQ